jgi:cell division protein ZapA (FtsZ GTPase activity inhibitor)
MSDAGKQPVRVTILNQQYSLRASGDPCEVEQVARRVDELLHSITDHSPTADSTRAAVLGCLHLADQLQTLERDLADLRKTVNSQAERLTRLLEQVELD